MAQLNLSLIDRFIAQYCPAQDAAVPTLPATTLDALERIHTRLHAAHRLLRDALLSAKDRDLMRGKTGPLTTTLLTAAARGLRRCPAFARKIGVSPEAVEELGQQRIAIAGDIQVLEIIVRRAEHCWYALSDAAQKDLRRVITAIEQVAGPEATRTPAQIATGALFEGALRLHRVCLEQKKAIAQEIALRHEEAAQPVQQRQDPVKTQKQVQQMLADFADGKGPLALPPVPAAPKSARSKNKTTTT